MQGKGAEVMGEEEEDDCLVAVHCEGISWGLTSDLQTILVEPGRGKLNITMRNKVKIAQPG